MDVVDNNQLGGDNGYVFGIIIPLVPGLWTARIGLTRLVLSGHVMTREPS